MLVLLLTIHTIFVLNLLGNKTTRFMYVVGFFLFIKA